MNIFVLKEEKRSQNFTDNAIRNCLNRDVEISRDFYGKPTVVNCENIHIGVTHANGLLFIAVWDKEFGIDAEWSRREVKNRQAIIHKYFFESENSELFLETFVKKEAYLKFLGTGLKDLKKADTSTIEFQKVDYKDYIMYIYTEFPVEKITIKELF